MAGADRFVGDPVDIVTGAVVDDEVDFRLPGAALPFAWVRRFDSRQLQVDRGLGIGFRHDLDHELYFDLDGMTYVDATWDSTSFPRLTRDGERASQGALTLERISALSYRIHLASSRVLHFRFASPHESSRLERISEGELAMSLSYESSVGGDQLSAVGLGDLGRLCIEWSHGHIARLALKQTQPERETELAAYRYDEHACLLEVRNAYKHTLRYSFDAQRNLVRKTDRRGFSFHFEYDAAHRCSASRGDDGAEAVQLEYRPLERTTFVTRHDGGKWQYQYNDAGVITCILDPLGGMQSYVIDERGRVRDEIDPLGNVTTVHYDARERAIAKRDPFGHWLSVEEDAAHPLEHRVAATPLEYEHGALFQVPGRLPAADTPLWKVPPDARNALQTAEPEWGGQTRLEQNLQGLPLREICEGDKARRWAFDENANVRWQIDFDGRKRTYEYTSDNHLAREIDASGRVSRYEYSATEQLTAFTDAGGTRSEYGRDPKDRVSEVRRHGKVRERYLYDYADNLIEKRDGKGELLLELTIGSGNLAVACKVGSQEIQAFEHDDSGQLIAARGAAGSCTFTYAASGMLLSDLRDESGVVHTRVSSDTWSTTVLGRFVTRYTRSANGELSITDPTGHNHRVGELAPGILQRQFSSGAREVAQYDLHGRCLLKTLEKRRNDGHTWVRSFHYSGEGDLLEQRDNERGFTRYTYDNSHRLQHVIHPAGRVDSYEYDDADNLLRLPGVEIATKLDLGSGNRLQRANAQTFQYDDRDHMARRDLPYGTVHYQYDALDQLTEIKAPDYKFSAKYDPLGRRSEKTVDRLTTRYYWDTDRLIAEVYPGGGIRVYVYEDALAMMPIMFVHYASLDAALESGRRFYVIANHIGAAELILNDQGEPAWQARVDPYGLARVEVGKHFNQPLRFPGHFYDAETGLHYNRFRYYDPTLGRYLESDPLGIEGGANLYAYTTNPLKEVDVRGEAAKCPNSLFCKAKKLVAKLGRALSEGAARVTSLLRKKPPPKPDHAATLRKHVRDAVARRQREAASNNDRERRYMVGGVINKKTGKLYDADNFEANEALTTKRLHPMIKKRVAAQDKIVDTNRRLLDEGRTTRDVRNMSDAQLRAELEKDGIPRTVEGMDTTAQLRRTNDRVKFREDQFAKNGESFHADSENWADMKGENGSHGEVLATSKALDDIGPDATPADLADLQVHNQKIPKKANAPISDAAFDRCTFCRGSTEGVDTTPELSAAESSVDQRIDASWQ